MKVLLVHDRMDVSVRIQGILGELGIPEHNIDVAEDARDARAHLGKYFYDVAIFDLTIPHMTGISAPDYEAAEQIFNELFRSTGLNAPGDIIGITRDAGAIARIDVSIGRHLMSIIEERDESGWEAQLRDRVSYALNSATARQRSAFSRYDVDALIVTALDEELRPYKDIFELSLHSYAPGVSTFIFADRDGAVRTGILHAIGRSGQASAASATQSLVTQFRPRVCFMSGFCGGFKAKTKLGQLVLAEAVFDWDYGKWKDVKGSAVFFPRPEPINIRNSQMHLVARSLVEDGLVLDADAKRTVSQLGKGKIVDSEILLMQLGSGSAVVGNAEITSRVEKLSDKIVGVDMEAFGFYFAASNAPVVRPEMLCIKAVADFCDKKKSDKFHDVCSFLSAKAVEDILLRRWQFE